MLPGKNYGPDDYLRIIWRRKWFIVLPTIVIGLTTAAWVYTLPNVYRSETSILIVPQRVPQNYVRSTVTTQLDDRLQMISQQILSRTRLERIIQEFNLYATQRRTMIMEDVVEQMRRDIGVNVSAGGRRRRADSASFRVTYDSSDPRTAMLVAERLASLFVQENLEDRELLADSTSQFLQAQLDDARRRLIEHEKKLEDFRQRNAGQLPSEVQTNLQMMQNAQVRLQTLSEASNRDRDRLLTIEGALSSPQPPSTTTATTDTAADLASQLTVAAGGGGPATKQLEAAKAALQALEMRLTPAHPDVVRAKRVIAELQAKADAEAQDRPLSAGIPAPSATPRLDATKTALTRAQSMQLEANELRHRIETRTQEEGELQRQAQAYAAKLQAAPALESQLTELMRDYATLQETYTGLLKKNEESKIAVNLERRQIGEQFKILDGARLPEKPISPNRLRLNMMGVGGGLALAIVLIGLLEYRDTTLKTDDDVMISLSLPVLAVIPSMVATWEQRRRTRRRRILALAASFGVAAMATVAAALWKTGVFQAWVR